MWAINHGNVLYDSWEHVSIWDFFKTIKNIYLFFELNALFNCSWVSVDQETVGRVLLGKHSLLDHVKDDLVWHELASFHHLIQLLAALGSWLDLSTEQVTAGEMGVSELLDDFFALCSLSTSGVRQRQRWLWRLSVVSHQSLWLNRNHRSERSHVCQSSSCIFAAGGFKNADKKFQKPLLQWLLIVTVCPG